MNSDPDYRSLRVDRELVQAMVRDTTIYSLTRPLGIVACVALIGAAVFTVIAALVTAPINEDQSSRLWFTGLGLIALFIVYVVFTRASARRALIAAMPEGSMVRVRVGEKALHVVAAQGVSNIPYETFNSIRVGRSAVLLKLRGTPVVTAVPRGLIDDADIALLRSKIS